MAPVARGWIGAWLDQFLCWRKGLPGEACNYTIDRVRIPMPDGVELVADLYQPQLKNPIGTILVRSPYGLALPMALGEARPFAARGYVVLLSTCRATAGSGGEFVPAVNELADGRATVAWMKKQPWYTGSFATIGASYLGYNQWCQLRDRPADMKAAVIPTGPHDFSNFIWGTGALNSDVITWAAFMAILDTRLPVAIRLMLPRPSLLPTFRSAPLVNGINAHFKGKTPAWLQHNVTHPDLSEPYWEDFRQTEALQRADIPVLLTGGWHDLILPDTMEQYHTLRNQNRNVALTVGPWAHIGAASSTLGETLAWLDEHLAGKTGRGRSAPVRVFVTGAQQWRDLPSWPPVTKPHRLHLGPSGLSEDAPIDDAAKSHFQFDPNDPTPDTGGSSLLRAKLDPDTALAARSDVLVFDTERLDQDLEICGKPSVSLYHSSEVPYADLLVRICEVDAKGVSRNIAETFQRLDAWPQKERVPLSLSLHDCAHRFARGSRIRLLIAGGSHPRFIRHLGTGDNPGTGSVLRPVWHTVQHNVSAPSIVVLPVTS